ncbi:AMP-binding protein [Streptomyces sp. NPDC003374]
MQACAAWSGRMSGLVDCSSKESGAPEVLVGLVARHGVTHTLTVPSFYAELLHTVREDERLARDLASLRLVICAGEGCPGHHPETLVAPGRVRGPPRCLLH